MHALLVMEELSGKVTVEEFDTISNGFRESRARERGSEWLKVQLKHKVPIETAKIERSQLTIKTRDISHQISKINKIFTQKKKKVGLPSINKFFLEVQVLRNLQLLNNKSMDVDSNVLPHSRPRPKSKSHPWRQNYGFLNSTTPAKCIRKT